MFMQCMKLEAGGVEDRGFDGVLRLQAAPEEH